jgi:glycosyltransferase involved in cell wall biosynthesis
MTAHSFRVLFLIENVPFSLDTRVRREAHTLIPAGAQVTVICPSDGRGAVRQIDGVCVYQYPKPSLGSSFIGHVGEYLVSLFFLFALTLWVALRRGFDVVHVANPPDLLWLVAAPYRLLGKRFVFDHHDLVPELFQVRYGDKAPGVVRVVLWLERMSIRLANHVICTNETFRSLAITRGGKDGRDVTVVRNGPWLSRDFPVPVNAPAPQPGLLVGYVGIMNPQDHTDHLIRAAHIVRHEMGRADIRFLLIGSGDAYESLRALRDSLGLRDTVEMPGTLEWPGVIKGLARTDICVQPDPPTAFNRHLTMNKLMEYMALGKATIAYDMPETRRSGDDTVFYVDSRDLNPAALAAAITRLADDPQMRAGLGTRARERIENMLSWEHQQGSLLSVYRQLLPMRFTTAAWPP